jgi:hypothetical protein
MHWVVSLTGLSKHTWMALPLPLSSNRMTVFWVRAQRNHIAAQRCTSGPHWRTWLFGHDCLQLCCTVVVLSLLHSSELMHWEKLNINPANPFAMYESPDGLLGEVLHSGAMYKALYAKHSTDPQRQLLTPCMLYFDKCHITNGSGRFRLEPATMTSTLFTE